jgi:hypothetical protein
MVQSTPDIAGSSVPDLRPSKRVGKLLLALGVLAIVGAVVVATVALRSGDGPGRAACDHIEQLADQDPERWDEFVKALARTVESRAWSSVQRKHVQIEGDTRYERCMDSFRVIRDTLTYSSYTTLSECVSKATTWRSGSTCFDTF